MSHPYIKDRDDKTQAVIDALLAVSPGQLVTYQYLSVLVGGDVQGDARHYLTSALKAVRRDYRRVCECVANVGVEVLTDIDIAVMRGKYAKKVHRAAKRNVDKLDCADMSVLPGKERDAVAKHMLTLHIVAEETAPRRLRKREPGPGDRVASAIDAAFVAGM